MVKKETVGKKTNRASSRRPVRTGQNAPKLEKIQVSVTRILWSRKFLVIASAVATIVVIVTSILLWFNKIYADPERAFWGMIDNNLSTKSVTREITQSQASATKTDVVKMAFTPAPRIHTVVKNTDSSTQPAFNSLIESIVTTTDEYNHVIRYESPSPSGQATDYSSIYGLWVKNDGKNQNLNNILGFLIFGNLSKDQRAQIVEGLKTAYHIDFNSVNRDTEQGRRTYTYNLTVSLQEFVKVASFYAQQLGLPFANELKPSDYKETDKVQLTVTVDVLSRQVKRVTYAAGSKIIEEYSGYGLVLPIELPSKTVTAQEFQNTINSISQ